MNQDYENLEIILIDDGSTDGSSSICDYYKGIDNRIKVIHKKNGGLSDARNSGIDIAKGDYLFFVDGDDYISERCISCLYCTLKKYNADIATTYYVSFNENQKPNAVDGRNKAYDSEKALEMLLYQKKCSNSAWGKLYKKRLFDTMRYPKGKICEDLPITYKLFSRANRVVIGKSKYYFYLQRNGSIIRSSFKPARLDSLTFAKEETDFIKKQYPRILKAAINREFMESIYIYNSIMFSDVEKYEKTLFYVKKLIKNYRKTVLFDMKAPLVSRLYALFGVERIKKTNDFIKRRNRFRADNRNRKGEQHVK